MSGTRLWMLALLAGCVLAGHLTADTIHLRNGRKLYGDVLEEKGERVTFEGRYIITIGTIGRVLVRTDDVVKIEEAEYATLVLQQENEDGTNVIYRGEIVDVSEDFIGFLIYGSEQPAYYPRTEVKELLQGRDVEEYIRAMQSGMKMEDLPTIELPPLDGGEGSGEPGSGVQPIPLPDSTQPEEGPTEPEVDENRVATLIRQMGDTGQGRAIRRNSAVRELAEMGAPVIPYVVEPLGDTSNWYRQRNAARVLARVAVTFPATELYAEAMPGLMSNLRSDHRWVRISANDALEAISGTQMGYIYPDSDLFTQSEANAANGWDKWWEKEQERLEAEGLLSPSEDL